MKYIQRAAKESERKQEGYIVTGRSGTWDIHWQIWQDFLV